MNKPKTPQPQTVKEIQKRDVFQSPKYSINLLKPFIPGNVKSIWECAYGEGKISNELSEYRVIVSDLKYGENHNFLTIDWPEEIKKSESAIITNPPFSLKKKFIEKAFYHNVPFAFLIPFDMSGFLCECFMKGCQGLVPTRRIDYITPTGLSGATGHSSYFHSFWLTYKFNLPDQLTFVELTNEMKKEI